MAIALAAATAAAAQPPGAPLAGVVVSSADGEPIAGASVSLEGGAPAVTTNGVGRFEIAAPPKATLVVSAPGYVTRSVPAGQPPLTIELDPSPRFVDTVQVTATKLPTRIGDVAAPTTIVDRETIDRRGDQRLTEAVEHVPGAFITTELGIFESVLFRGMPRVGNEFTNTLLLIDGVPQTNSGNEARVVALPINDASSIEVVRGPNSALYGRTAIGGAINVLTAEPSATPQLEVDLAGGQFGFAKGVASVSGPIAGWGGYYVSIGRERSGGYFTNKIDTDFDMGNTAVFGKFKFAPDPQGYGTVSINRVSSANSTPTNEPVLGGQLLHEIDPAFERFTSFNLPGPNYEQGETRFTFNYTRQLTDWARLVETFGYRDVRLEFIEDGDFIGEPYDLENQTVTMYPFSQRADERIFYQEARVDFTADSGNVSHTLTVGGSYEHNNGDLAFDFIYTDEDLFGFPNISYVNPVIPDRSTWQHDTGTRDYNLGIAGIFAQYMIEPADRLIVTLGGRYDRLALDATRGTAPKAEDTFEAFSPKASATVRLLGSTTGAALNAYGAYAQAFLPPRRPSALVPDDVPLNLQPEDIANYEGGLKGILLDGRLAIEGSYFYMTDEGVVLSRRQGAFFLPTNAGERKFKGFETGVTYSPQSAVSTYVNASFYRHRFGDFVIESDEGDTVLTGNHLILSPDHIVNWGASIYPASPINVSFDVKHVGETFGNDDNSFRLDGYTVVDAAVSWRRGPLRITLSGRNLLDEEYYFDGNNESADPAPPRQVLVSTSILFR